MKAICEARKVWRYPANGGGAQEVDAPWIAPSEVSADLKHEAEIALCAAQDACKPATDQLVRRWLASLGMLCAGALPVAEAKAKVCAYASLLEYPVSCFTRDTLRTAAERFKWLPSFSELTEYLSGIAGPLYALRNRLQAISEARLAIAGPEVEPQSPDEAAAVRQRGAALLRQCVASLSANAEPEERASGRPRYLRDGPPPEEMREWRKPKLQESE